MRHSNQRTVSAPGTVSATPVFAGRRLAVRGEASLMPDPQGRWGRSRLAGLRFAHRCGGPERAMDAHLRVAVDVILVDRMGRRGGSRLDASRLRPLNSMKIDE